jgi:hypothetical protein
VGRYAASGGLAANNFAKSPLFVKIVTNIKVNKLYKHLSEPAALR